MARLELSRTIDSNLVIDKEFIISDVGVVIDILTSKLYSDPVATTIQELVSNARDSQIEAGSDRPCEIYLPTAFNKKFKIRDYGTGLSKEFMLTRFCAIGDSTKRESDEFIGSFGLGRLSPFSFVDSFQVESYYNGKFVNVLIARINSSISLTVLGEGETYKPNGLEVSFSVPDSISDSQLLDIINYKFFSWDEKYRPIIKNREGFKYVEIEKHYFDIRDELEGTDNSDVRAERSVFNGNIVKSEVPTDYWYAFKEDEVSNLISRVRDDASQNILFVSGLPFDSFSSNTIKLRRRLLINFPTGSFRISPSRESVHQDDLGDFIHHKFSGIVDLVDESVMREIVDVLNNENWWSDVNIKKKLYELLVKLNSDNIRNVGIERDGLEYCFEFKAGGYFRLIAVNDIKTGKQLDLKYVLSQAIWGAKRRDVLSFKLNSGSSIDILRCIFVCFDKFSLSDLFVSRYLERFVGNSKIKYSLLGVDYNDADGSKVTNSLGLYNIDQLHKKAVKQKVSSISQAKVSVRRVTNITYGKVFDTVVDLDKLSGEVCWIGFKDRNKLVDLVGKDVYEFPYQILLATQKNKTVISERYPHINKVLYKFKSYMRLMDQNITQNYFINIISVLSIDKAIDFNKVYNIYNLPSYALQLYLRNIYKLWSYYRVKTYGIEYKYNRDSYYFRGVSHVSKRYLDFALYKSKNPSSFLYKVIEIVRFFKSNKLSQLYFKELSKNLDIEFIGLLYNELSEYYNLDDFFDEFDNRWVPSFMGLDV